MMYVPRSKDRKKKLFEEFSKLIQEHRYVILVDSTRLKASMLNEVRRLQPQLGFRIKGGKKTVFLKALEKIYPEAVEKLKDEMFGQILFIFTNEDPIKIAMELDKYEVDIAASPGDITPVDIVIPEGNTGIPPGPVISLFSNLSIPTKIVGGAINVVKDTLVARAGDKISPNLANLLNKLGIKPIKSKVNLKAAYDFKDNILITREYLIPDLEKIKSELSEAFGNAFKISLELGYPTKYNVSQLLLKAYLHAKKLAVEGEFITPETIKDIVIAAYTKALALQQRAEAS